MFEPHLSESATAPRPRIFKVILLILLASLFFSYLIAYAVMNTLSTAGLLPPLPRDADPRPRWLLMTFSTIIAVISVSAIALRWTSGRHLSRIDDLADADENLDEN
jgi:quinol-cytochrome oxidoreductase complex cytochrome b subunit